MKELTHYWPKTQRDAYRCIVMNPGCTQARVGATLHKGASIVSMVLMALRRAGRVKQYRSRPAPGFVGAPMHVYYMADAAYFVSDGDYDDFASEYDAVRRAIASGATCPNAIAADAKLSLFVVRNLMCALADLGEITLVRVQHRGSPGYVIGD